MTADYWREAVAQSLEEHGVAATDEQIVSIASDMEGASDCRYMGGPDTPHPAIGEAERLKRELKTEREKVQCRACGGSGRISTRGGTFESNSECWKCRGEGRYSP